MGGAERGAPEQAEAVPGAVAGLHADKALLDVLLRLPLVEAQHLHDEAGPGLAHEGDGAEGVDGREGEDEARDFDGAGQGRARAVGPRGSVAGARGRAGPAGAGTPMGLGGASWLLLRGCGRSRASMA